MPVWAQDVYTGTHSSRARARGNERKIVNGLGKKLILAATAAALVLGLAACDVTPGGACSQEGSKATNKNGTTYTCKQVPGGKRIWQQDGVLTPDRP